MNKSIKETIDLLEEKLNESNQYSSFISYDYSTVRNCKGNGCDYICRCGRIEHCRIEFGPQKLAEEIGTSPEEIWIYSWWFKQNIKEYHFTYSIGRGYYGDELKSISCEDVDGICQKFEMFLENNKTLSEKIECLLVQEYSYVQEDLKNKGWFLKEVLVSDVLTNAHFKNKNTVLEILKGNPDFYSNIPLCKKIGKVYQIIDGHHRFEVYKNGRYEYSLRGNKIPEKITVVYCENEHKE